MYKRQTLLSAVVAYAFSGLLVLCFVAAGLWMYHLYDLWRNGMTSPTRSVTAFAYGVVSLIGAWAALVYLHGSSDFGPAWTIAAMAVVWAADSCAYFAGKTWGRHKLAPEISPGKTIEGVVGGLVGSGVLAALMGAFLPGGEGIPLWAWVLASVVAAAVSVGGDLYESRLKRHAGVKDSGTLLPGHGGILDRIDGLLPATPVLVTLLVLLT